MAKRNIGATLTLKAGNFFTNMKSAQSQVQGFKKQISGSTSSVKSFGSSVTNAGTSVSDFVKKAVAIAAVTASFAAATSAVKDMINTGAEFESQMATVQAISGAAGAEFDSLTQKAMEMGSKTKFSAVESAQAMEYMAMAGWKSSDMISGIKGIMNLAAASGEDLASVSDIVTDSLTAFGLKASDSAQFADILAKAASASNTNVAMLGQSFKYAAPAAGALGYDVRDVTTALGLMANAGIKSDQAGTAMRAWMTRMAKPTKEVQTAMTALNLSFVNADGSMKPLTTLIPEMQKKFTALSESEKGQYAAMLAGQEAMSGFLAVVNAAPGDFENLSEQIYNSGGAAKSMADTMNDTLSGQLTLLKSQVEGVKIAIYQSLGSSQFKGVINNVSKALASAEPYIKNIAVGLGNGVFNAINSLVPAVNAVGGIFTKIFGAVSAALAVNRNAVQSVKTKFEELKNSFIGFMGEGNIQMYFDLVSDSAVKLATGALSTLFDALKWGVDNFELVKNSVIGVIAVYGAYRAAAVALAAGNVISAAFSVGSVAINAMRISLSRHIATVGAATTAQKLSAAAQWAWNAAMSANPVGIVIMAVAALTAAVVALYMNWDKIRANFPKTAAVVESVLSALKAAFLLLLERAKMVFSVIATVAGFYLNQVKLIFTAVFATVGNIVTTAVNHFKIIFWGVVSHVILVGTFIKQIFTGDFKGAAQTLGNIVKNITDTIKRLFENSFNGVKNQIDIFKNYFKGTFDNVKNMVSGVWTAITEGGRKSFNSIAEFINNTLGRFKLEVPEWVPAIGGKTFSIPKIPMLAKGGVVKSEGSVMVGEKGPEVLSLPRGATVTPLARYNTTNNTTQKTTETRNQNTFYITVYADNRSEDEMANRMARKIKAVLDTL